MVASRRLERYAYATFVLLLLTSQASASFLTDEAACGVLQQEDCEAWVAIDDQGEDIFAGMVMTRAGILLTAGRAMGNTPDGSFYEYTHIVARNVRSGEFLWQANLPAIDNRPEAWRFILSHDEATAYLVGSELVGFAAVSHIFVFAFHADNGAVKWTFRGPPDSYGTAVATSPDDSVVYVTGSYRNNYITYALNASDASTRWVRTYDGQGGYTDRGRGWSFDRATDVAATSDGTRIFITGTSNAQPDGAREYATIAYDTQTGAQLWLHRYHDEATVPAVLNAVAEGYVLALSPTDDHLYVMGNRGVVAYDAATGTPLWVSARSSACIAYWPSILPNQCALRVSPSGDAVYAWDKSILSALDATSGIPLWSRPIRLDGGLLSTGAAMGLSADGKTIYVATQNGLSEQTDSNRGQGTWAIDATAGTPLWHVTFGDGIGDTPKAIAVTPDGEHVVVGGAIFHIRQGPSDTRVDDDIALLTYPTRAGLAKVPHP